MKRRSFLAALAGMAVAGPSALDALAKHKPPPIWDFGHQQWASIRSDSLVTNAIGEITEVTRDHITVRWSQRNHTVSEGDLIVWASA